MNVVKLLNDIDDAETEVQNKVMRTCGGPNCSCDYAARSAIETLVTKIRRLLNNALKGIK